MFSGKVQQGGLPPENPKKRQKSRSVAVELSQLYHAPWIDSIRHTTIGGLILGFGFLWSDLACYSLGVGLGVLIEIIGGIVTGEDRS